MNPLISSHQISELYQQACEIELRAFKPGNVSVYSEGHDMTVEDFRLSYQSSAKAMANPNYSLGEKIYYAVKETQKSVACNTNLGILLLCAPMIKALETGENSIEFRTNLAHVLETTTIEDADWVFKAITLASPGGLGNDGQADVKKSAAITLTQAMNLAKNRDRIALQYSNNYKDIFDFTILRYNKDFTRWGSMNWAAVSVYATLLRQYPDSHIERKYGTQYTRMVTDKMDLVDKALLNTDNPQELEAMLYEVDKTFKATGINPGTSADLTVATIFASLVQGLLKEKL